MEKQRPVPCKFNQKLSHRQGLDKRPEELEKERLLEKTAGKLSEKTEEIGDKPGRMRLT